MAFKENLRYYREKAGLTAKELASKLGISYTTYLNYENIASEPRYSMLLKICHILGKSPNDLLGYTGSENDRFDIALRDLRASGFHDDYNEEVKIALALGAQPDAVNEFNVLFGADPESEYCFKCSPDLLIEAYDFVHSSENEQAFNNLKFGLYIKAFFQYQIGRDSNRLQKKLKNENEAP
ncbi:helix-turn-helix domain-containing protein [Acidaminococcus sp. HCP3S3_G9_1]|uniref:helix-turn-helix domain-containing protein n=1 Tax=Acidaminococcus sp. HCP3S3_G9_1 TaxID=3438732 RepID=UPI003F8E66DA